jgi:DNA-binding CsgD family transcriptional regulator
MRRWPFVGRDAELAGIRSAYADTAASGVVLVGRAGVGKTRLARAAPRHFAADAYRRAGARTRAALALERGAEPRAACEGAVTPLLSQTSAVARLTRRERAVALPAARYSSRQVADRLGLSITPVNNHLARAYAKPGISRRARLAELIDGANTS